MNVAPFFEKRGKVFWGISGMGFVILLGILDLLLDRLFSSELTFSLFYLLPIFAVSWYASQRLGLFISAVSAVTLFVDDVASNAAIQPAEHLWNTVTRVMIFFILTALVSALKKSVKTNQELAREDFVTGAISIRYFYELAKTELNRCLRYKHPLSLAYIDLDNFKQINDRLGHSTGDMLLRTVTGIIQRHVRPTDVFARLGGDEFALLLPETTEEEVKKSIARIHAGLVNEMLKNGWMVTFSVGVVTFHRPPKSVDEMIKVADQTMYAVKTKGKNGVKYHVV
jgi:diguanylate cyclase (GGDEF)-like protein